MQFFGIFVGEFVSWMNKRLPDNKKVFSRELFKEYKEYETDINILILDINSRLKQINDKGKCC